MRIREATLADNSDLTAFVANSPLSAGTHFVLDRSPDFFRLLQLRGNSRTFIAESKHHGIAGIVTALWHDVRDEKRDVVRLGEIVDLRVAPWARGGGTTARLLHAAKDALIEAVVSWVVFLIGDRNTDAKHLISGRAGLPKFEPLTRFASIHYIAWRPPRRKHVGHAARAARPDEIDILNDLHDEMNITRRFVPQAAFDPADLSADQLSWIIPGANGKAAGGLVVWDGYEVRRVRIIRYQKRDTPLRICVSLASRLGLANRLPNRGEVLRIWASRFIGLREPNRGAIRSLVDLSLRAATDAGAHVVQLNLPETDPLLKLLPRYPRSIYWSTLYGRPVNGNDRSFKHTGSDVFHADVALV
jgi:hypothetical protein